jgi:hypothetical protein
MRVLVCGGRNYFDRTRLFEALDREYLKRPFSHLIHGGAKGADALADEWASQNSVVRLPFYADWDMYGLGAGPMRNARMLKEGMPDLVIAFPGGRGTANMIGLAQAAGIEVRHYSLSVRPEEGQ